MKINFLKFFFRIYLKKTAYKFTELKEELNIDMRLFLKEINNWESIGKFSKDFFLYKRLYFLFKEYDRIIKIWNTINSSSNSKEETNNYSTQYYNNKIIPMIQESSKEMVIYYECLSEEINRMFKRIEKISLDNCVKLASEGWSGNVFALGKVNEVNKIGEAILEYYDLAFENKAGEGLNANLWISDEVHKYCYWSEIGGSISFLNPVYEDFMLLDLK